ncbi:MAG: dTDP-glucose 4,6-dehydratase [Nitrosopumilaceae archaeon]|nr:dTDP-glucose 4,6-dehydratase [Nitrosopumilaceae archaeon]NIU01395.1 dTDP-glucose 4,6-dehydratase [Nitrosopumilaceae archaeon]NIU87753.1 dTDP-glucose 4,6-dehydratase [Nitrosopumilaceae archaeon]NIV66131.1 dTDP-glucose 4,6-dehydratase [Nitrosopumilaceae archaeon]NIX61997.1 dTDP-glucose 4,6-dehydratase [Nitrosopumilaceae archaeon]
MKLLVTGGLGFIGSNFILHTFRQHPDYEIYNIDDELIGSNHNNLKDLGKNKRYHFVKGNIDNKKLVKKLVAKCDTVINFAAESHVDRSISAPKPFIDSNIMGVYILLEAIRTYEKRLIHISTDEVFGSLRKGSAKEGDAFNPASPYAASKAAAEMLIKSYFKTYGCDLVITRCTNNYGPRQFEEKLIPKVILNANKDKKIPVYGTGKNIRDWIFVLDHCDALLKVLFKGRPGKSYNISAGNEFSNLKIIKKILKLMGKTNSLIEFTEDRLGHDFRYSMDSTKTRNFLNWKPRTKFDYGLEQTIKWYLKRR